MATTILDSPRIAKILFPYMERKRQEIMAAGSRFVYYTTAETATNILKNRQVWLRSTTAMNDYMEVEHGFECLNAAYKGEAGQSFNRALDGCFPGLAEELRDFFNAWLPGIREETYLICVSEHLAEEDRHGRLSMWRGYGGDTGIAIVLNGDVILRESHAVGAYSSPVAYLTPAGFTEELQKVAENISVDAEYMKTLDRETVKNYAFNMLRFAVLCTKHPGFHEEREWRIVACPVMHPSELLALHVEVVRGTPQTVLKLNLEDHPDHGVAGLALPQLLDRIIIGPCELPVLALKAFRQLLTEAGVPTAEEKVFVSDIPLRHIGA